MRVFHILLTLEMCCTWQRWPYINMCVSQQQLRHILFTQFHFIWKIEKETKKNGHKVPHLKWLSSVHWIHAIFIVVQTKRNEWPFASLYLSLWMMSVTIKFHAQMVMQNAILSHSPFGHLLSKCFLYRNQRSFTRLSCRVTYSMVYVYTHFFFVSTLFSRLCSTSVRWDVCKQSHTFIMSFGKAWTADNWKWTE